MREGIRNLGEGLALAFGVVWLLLATLLLGSLIVQSTATQNLSDTGTSIGVVAAGAVWACGGVFVVIYALAIMRGRYLIALVAGGVSLIGIWIASRGPLVATDRHGPVPTLELTVAIAAAIVLVAGGLGWSSTPGAGRIGGPGTHLTRTRSRGSLCESSLRQFTPIGADLHHRPNMAAIDLVDTGRVDEGPRGPRIAVDLGDRRERERGRIVDVRTGMLVPLAHRIRVRSCIAVVVYNSLRPESARPSVISSA